jgi:predicted dehydrogenase
MAEHEPLPVAALLVGSGARTLLPLLQRHARATPPLIRLVGVFCPELSADCVAAAKLGIPLLASEEELLASDARAVLIAAPPDLHRLHVERALGSGKAVLLDKPAAGCVDDCDAMIAARDAANLPVHVAFPDLCDPLIRDAKGWLLEQAIGDVRYATFRACWPRDSVYFQRNDRAGRLRHDGGWVLDSPASGALSDFVLLTLFLLGREPDGVAMPKRVQAELYRVNPIETYDTCAIRAQFDGALTALFLMTLASPTQVDPMIVVRGTHGMLEVTYAQLIIRNRGGTRTIPRPQELPDAMVRSFVAAVRGEQPTPPAATLEAARGHVALVNGASEASVVHDVPQRFVKTVSTRKGAAVLRSVPGIDAFLRGCAFDNVLPFNSRRLPWARPAGGIDLRDYQHFKGPKQPAPAAPPAPPTR